MVARNDRPYALFFAACYDHGDVRESWIDVAFGTWGEGTDYHDHVTFGCRFGPVSNSPLPAATAVDAAAVAPDGPLFGSKLSRADAPCPSPYQRLLAGHRFIVETDALVHKHHYGHRPAPDFG